jgi:hypothetical protein
MVQQQLLLFKRMGRFQKKNSITLFSILFFCGVFFVHSVYAGTLVCTMRNTACVGDEIEVYEMYSTSNSHAGLPAAAYDNLVCCNGVTGLSNVCGVAPYATVLKLSGTTNAHVKQGTLPDYPSATNACLSVPFGGTVTVGYQATNCDGYDTTLGSMIGTENSHVGNSAWAASDTQICATASAGGTLFVKIVDAGGVEIVNPDIPLPNTSLKFLYQSVAGTVGEAVKKIRIDNATANAKWSVAIAATDGPSALWDATPASYDYNDPTASAVDGVDADSVGGQMSLDPSMATVTPEVGCMDTGLVYKDPAAFSQGVVNSITLLESGLAAETGCYWDITGIPITQTIPKEQTAASDYAINMTLTITAL